MKIGIVTHLNGIGLQRDAELLSGFLTPRGHEVTLIAFDQPAPVDHFELLIFLEVMVENFVALGDKSWIFVNPEWLKPEYVRPIQRNCSKVFAKTREAEKVLREMFSNVHYTGFLTEDRREKVKKIKSCLHIGGNSGYRNTNAVMSAWREYRYWDDVKLPPLTVVSSSRETIPFEDTPGITFIKRATDEQIRHLQNSHLFHLYPSAYEGWGHALHEAQSVGAVILTTQAAPMTEFLAPFEVKPSGTRKVNMGTIHEVSPQAIREIVPKMLEQPSHVIAKMQLEARMRFEKDNREFAERFEPHFKCASATHSQCNIADAGTGKLVGRSQPLRIAFLGNFKPPHSTENDLKWTLEDMGHEVVPFQEDEADVRDIVHDSSEADLFLWVHTHGFDQLDSEDMLSRLHSNNVKTASFHLDRYWGLNELDQRENKIGKHPFWHTDFVFTADGGNRVRFEGRGIRHFWLPPGVCGRDIRVHGERREDLSVDVGFVGAEGYHPEYPFRGQLIEFLRSVYGEKFRVFQGYRGQALNDLYASIKVVVGDSCFGGADFYWSDRVPETLGRGGFLIHPASKGLAIPGLVAFEPGNLQQLQDRIDYFLANELERTCLRTVAHEWVKKNETYTNRMKKLLEVCGLG